MKAKLIKISALLIVFLLVFQTCSFSQEITEVQEQIPFSYERDAMESMELVTEDLLALDSADTVSRSIFIGNMFKLVGFYKMAYDSNDNTFEDLTDDTLYKDEIISFYKRGLINGTGDKSFSPDADITVAQAVKISLDMLGYREYINARYKGSLEGYLITASDLDITDDMKFDDDNACLTAYDAFVLMYNVAISPIYETTSITMHTIGHTEKYQKGDMLLSSRDIYYDEGIVYSNGIVNIKDSMADVDYAIIGNQKYNLNGIDIADFLGCKVKLFYKLIHNNTRVLLWAHMLPDNDVLILDSDELIQDNAAYSGECIVYSKGNYTKKAYVDKYATVVYNNALHNDFTMEQFKPEAGTIRLIDNDSDRVYDLVVIEEFDNIFVTAVGDNESFIADKFGKLLFFDDYDNVKIIKDGRYISAKEIPVNVVVSYLESRDKKHLYLYVNGFGSEDELKAVSEDADGTVLYFEKGEYELAGSYTGLSSNYTRIDLIAGNAYKYFLDKSGKIAYIEDMDNGGLQYAYLLKCAPDNTGFADSGSAKFRFLLSDGTKVDVVSKDKLVLNNTPKKCGIDIINYINNNSIELPVVVKVAFNANSDVKEIEFATEVTNPYGYDKNKFTLDFESEKSYFNTDNCYMFERKYTLTSGTVCFVTYTGSSESEPYGVIRYNDFNNSNYPVKVYDCDENFEAAAISTTRSITAVALDGVILVDKVTRVLVDGDSVTQIKGINRGNYVTYYGYEDGCVPANLKKGDIITVSLFNQRITKVNILARLSEKPQPFIKGEFGSSICYIYGQLYSRSSSSIVTVNPEGNSRGLLTSTSTRNNERFYVSVYDYRNKDVYIGNPNDAHQYFEPDSNGDLPQSDSSVSVFLCRRYNYLMEAIVVYY